MEREEKGGGKNDFTYEGDALRFEKKKRSLTCREKYECVCIAHVCMSVSILLYIYIPPMCGCAHQRLVVLGHLRCRMCLHSCAFLCVQESRRAAGHASGLL